MRRRGRDRSVAESDDDRCQCQQHGRARRRRGHRAYADRTKHDASLRHADCPVTLDERARREDRCTGSRAPRGTRGSRTSRRHTRSRRRRRPSASRCRTPARSRARARRRPRWRTRRRSGLSSSRQALPRLSAWASSDDDCALRCDRPATGARSFPHHAAVRAHASSRRSVTMQSTPMSCGAAGTASTSCPSNAPATRGTWARSSGSNRS